MATIEFEYSQSIDDVFAKITDPTYVTTRSEALGERKVVVKVDDISGGKRVTIHREVDTDLPSIAKKLFKPTNSVVETTSWKRTGDRIVGEFEIDVKGAPTRVWGKNTLRPQGAGCGYSVDFDATVSVPLIGKKIRKFVIQKTEEGFRNVFAYNVEHFG